MTYFWTSIYSYWLALINHHFPTRRTLLKRPLKKDKTGTVCTRKSIKHLFLHFVAIRLKEERRTDTEFQKNSQQVVKLGPFGTFYRLQQRKLFCYFSGIQTPVFRTNWPSLHMRNTRKLHRSTNEFRMNYPFPLGKTCWKNLAVELRPFCNAEGLTLLNRPRPFQRSSQWSKK